MAMISAATAPKLKRNIKTRVLCAARTNAVIKGRHAGEGRSTTNALRWSGCIGRIHSATIALGCPKGRYERTILHFFL